MHALTFRHALGAGGALLNWAFSRGPVPMVGDSYTVRKASVDVRSPYNVVDISSYRQVLDVGNWDQSRAVNTTGQSGNTMSPHYFDQNPLWSCRHLPHVCLHAQRSRESQRLPPVAHAVTDYGLRT